MDVLGLVGLKTMAGGAVKVSNFLPFCRHKDPHHHMSSKQSSYYLYKILCYPVIYIRIPTVASWTSFIAIDQPGFHASFCSTGAVLVATPRKDKMDKRLGYWARVVSRAGFTGVFGSDDQVPELYPKRRWVLRYWNGKQNERGNKTIRLRTFLCKFPCEF